MKKLILAITLLIPIIASAQLADSSKRLVHVNAANFRDIGGYKTTDGKEVVWGKIYRSAAISKLTEADLELLDKKGIHTVVDFRGTAESAAAPDRLPKNTDYTLCPAGSENLPDAAQMVALLKNGNFLGKMYGSDGAKYAGDRYRTLFMKLLTLDKKEAVLFHCTGGRDRTGMATALLLYILKVPQETIEADYVASNVYLKEMHKNMFTPLAKMSGLTVEAVEKEMALRPELLRDFFNELKKQYGSIENFLQQELAIGPKEITILRATYTK
ncbi:tyrosine-protein phosphatase [Pedobacter frigiditerrae]|uniref:Tyrosine-protein phosphatase n=1 Tax=Pedobacter frigiditerrae TaxID=2530452 RepID=A0A4R0MW35_9SPHI|nr:tyrosine-protein phosphatase [Pedobacter frigiditerrae]TCC90134.1 tyrosine-protein phosphatase [Pedobacter frigiditerrae]